MIKLLTGDCRTDLAAHGPFDMVLVDPPYGDTSLAWDKKVKGWHAAAKAMLKPTGSLWVFGSLRFFMASQQDFAEAGWRYAQDVVWQKHNGSSFHADRFRRVHEHVVQFYARTTPWAQVWNDVQFTRDATRKTVRRKTRPTHTGNIGAHTYTSQDGGPRRRTSIIPIRSCHGYAIHPTEKPVGLLQILIRTSCPPGGLVGDMFAGSGAVGEACAHAGRDYVGIEIDADIAERARDRLAGNLFTSAPFTSAPTVGDKHADPETLPAGTRPVQRIRAEKHPALSE